MTIILRRFAGLTSAHFKSGRHRAQTQLQLPSRRASDAIRERNVLLQFSEDLRLGVGGDLRYPTGLGPIRLDAAVPLDPRDGDPNFASMSE